MTKQQAIKEIEKLTGYTFEYEDNGVICFNRKDTYLEFSKDKTNAYFWNGTEFNDTIDDLDMPFSWVLPLSRLIPILFKEETNE